MAPRGSKILPPSVACSFEAISFPLKSSPYGKQAKYFMSVDVTLLQTTLIVLRLLRTYVVCVTGAMRMFYRLTHSNTEFQTHHLPHHENLPI